MILWLQDYGLDVEEFRKLPEVVAKSSCPQEFMELAFLTCRVREIPHPHTLTQTCST